MTDRLYKWMLRRDGQLVTAVQKNPWPVAVGGWTAKESPVLCESGWHGMAEKDVLQHLPSELGAELWVVETRGRRLIGDDKFAAPRMRLVECIGVTDDSNLRLFACDVAEDAMSLIDSPDPRSVQAVEVARRFAVGEATEGELAAARDSAREAARGAAEAAAWDSARAAAWDAAWAAAWAARAAAWAARAAARDAAWAAAWARYSNWLVVRLESGY